MGQPITAERIEEGRQLYARLCAAIETDDDIIRDRTRTALQMWCGAALQDGLLNLAAEALEMRKRLEKAIP